MKDNTDITSAGIEIYRHDINYYADEYIRNELEIDHVDQESKKIVKDSFVDMLFYISDRISKPDNADIKALDNIFSVYVRLCSKYSVNPTLEAFSFLVDINRATFTSWNNGDYRTQEHSDTVKKWMNICKGFLVNNLGIARERMPIRYSSPKLLTAWQRRKQWSKSRLQERKRVLNKSLPTSEQIPKHFQVMRIQMIRLTYFNKRVAHNAKLKLNNNILCLFKNSIQNIVHNLY